MTRRAKLISLVSMATLLLFSLAKSISLGTSSESMKRELSYFIEHPAGASLDPIQSDQIGNAVLVKHLVGTLVRYANGGQFEPYLAESFSPSERNTVWHFKLRDGLKCQDGEPITAPGYIEGLLKVLRGYASMGPIPIISDLVGWEQFAKGEALEGITSVGPHEVVFRFHKPVGGGFLEYLSMSYYGYFCRSNFNGDKWISSDTLVSSGPYQLAEPVTDRFHVKLRLRKDWSLAPEFAPQQVSYYTKMPSDVWSRTDSIVQHNLNWEESVPKGFRRVWGPPDNIRAVVLNEEGPTRFFAESANRKSLQYKILEFREKTRFAAQSASIAKSFYPGYEPPSLPAGESGYNPSKPSAALSIFVPASATDETKYMVAITTSSLRELGWDFEIITPNDANKLTGAAVASRTKFDIRIANVVAGSVIEPWVVEMMFCSNLGISFPDPSRRVCKFARELLESNMSFSVHEAGANVSKIVYEDAAVIPIYHGRTTWYFHANLDVSRIAGDLILPSFEDISLKER